MLIERVVYLQRAVGKFVRLDASGFNLPKIGLHWKRWGQGGGGGAVSEGGGRVVAMVL